MKKKKSGGDGTGKKKGEANIDEVEELLKLTQDDLLLKLTVNSHLTSKPKPNFIPSSSSSNLDTDLDRRFEALRSKKNSNPETQDDDLFARFAALKGGANATPAANSNAFSNFNEDEDEDEDEEDEVKKIISWAVDAARLDPSPSSDIDDSDSDKDSDSDDEVASTVDCKKKGSKNK